MPDETPHPNELWENLDTKTGLALKAISGSMVYSFGNEGDLTPLGKGVAWWLNEKYSDMDHEAALEYLKADLRNSLHGLPSDGSKGQVRAYMRRRAAVIKEARRLGEQP